MKLKYDEPLSKFGFNFKLRPYIVDEVPAIRAALDGRNASDDMQPLVVSYLRALRLSNTST